MMFDVARCALCGEYLFKPADAVYLEFERLEDPPAKKRLLRPIDVKGRQPWAGIRTVCLDCARVVAGAVGKKISESPDDVG